MILEGPIITVLSGFLVYLGFLNIFIVYPLLVVGDLIGDSIYYGIGRYCSKFSWVSRLENFLKYDEKEEEFLKKHFKKHTVKTLLIAKITHGLGIPVQITAGIANVNFFEYISIETVGTMVKTLVLLVIGFYLGGSYLKINNYFQFFSLITIAAGGFLIFYLVLNKYLKNYFK